MLECTAKTCRINTGRRPNYDEDTFSLVILYDAAGPVFSDITGMDITDIPTSSIPHLCFKVTLPKMALIHKSPFPTPPLPRQSVFHYLFPYDKSASPYPVPDPDTVSFIEYTTDRRVTRGELESQAKRLATGLRGLGMQRGDVACIFSTNSLEWINAMFGCQAAGIRVSPASFGYTAKELLHQVQHSRSTLIFLAPSSLPTLFKALEDDSHLSNQLRDGRIVLLCQKHEKGEHGAGYPTVEELWGEEGEVERFEDGAEHETAFLCYSSGTVRFACFSIHRSSQILMRFSGRLGWPKV